MKFSFFMMPVHRPTENPSLAFDRDIGLIHLADELGYDEFLIGEHHSGGWETMPVPEMALAMAAATAKRIRLGTSVTLLPYHHPFHVAERIAFLDHLTKGRAILGIGPSTLVTDRRLFRMATDQVYPMMHEAVEVIVRLLESTEPISHHGRFWQFDDMRLQLRSYQQPRLPLAIATGGSQESLALAGRYNMIVMQNAGNAMNRSGSKASHWAQVEEAAKAHGTTASRDNWRLVTAIYLADTAEQAWVDVGDGIMREAHYFSTVGLKANYELYPGQPFAEFTPQSCVEGRQWIVGTPDDAIAWIERMQAETGGFGGLLLTAHEWAAPEKIRRSIELFARYVMPHFRGHTTVLKDEWRRLEERPGTLAERTAKGDGKPSNLVRLG